MFTGIVETTGVVAEAVWRGEVLAVRIDSSLELAIGGSVAVNGCCLTAVAVAASGFTCELTGETLARTAFGERLKPGAIVNLERPLRADGRLDGHIVQGHVDCVGSLRALRSLGSSAELEVALPAGRDRYLVEKGSIAVDGISLTVASLLPGAFTVAIIPYTLDVTNLRAARPGDALNLEFDVIAKYVERLISYREA
jgi:riboflavin synthase